MCPFVYQSHIFSKSHCFTGNTVRCKHKTVADIVAGGSVSERSEDGPLTTAAPFETGVGETREPGQEQPGPAPGYLPRSPAAAPTGQRGGIQDQRAHSAADSHGKFTRLQIIIIIIQQNITNKLNIFDRNPLQQGLLTHFGLTLKFQKCLMSKF